MGPGFTVLFLLLVLGAFALIWSVSLVVFIFSLKQKRRWLGIASFIPLLSLTVMAMVGAGAMGYGIVQSMRPKVVFEQTFGTAASAEIKELQSKYWFFADSGVIYLKFRCSEEQFRALKPDSLEMRPFEEIDQTLHSYSDASPSWWKPQDPRRMICFATPPHTETRKHFHSESEILIYDPDTGTAYYLYSGID